MTSSILKKLAVLTVGSSMVLGLTACDGADVGLIAIGIGVIAICADDDVDCSTRRYPHYDDHHHHRPPRDHHHWPRSNEVGASWAGLNAIKDLNQSEKPQLTIEDAIALGQSDIDAKDWAKHFNLSVESSEKIISALEDARSGKVGGWKELGLEYRDLAQLAKWKSPSRLAVSKMSFTLGEDLDSLQAMFDELTTTAQSLAIAK